MMGEADPFYAVRDTLAGTIAELRIDFDRWRAMLLSTNTATDVTFQRTHDAFREKLGKTEGSYRKVRDTITKIEANRGRFPHITDGEIAKRKALMGELERQLIEMHEAFNSRETRGKIEADAKRELAARAEADVFGGAAGAATGARGGAGTKPPSAYTAANAAYMGEKRQEMSQIRREQDTTLDSMASGLDRLGEMARGMEDELKEQAGIMEDVENEIDATQGKMDATIKHVEKLLQTKDKCTLITIASLTVAFVIVAIVAIYTLTG